MPCALCGRPIDYNLPAYTIVDGKRIYNDQAFELDEIVPVSRAEMYGYSNKTQAAIDPNNVQPTHRCCNRKKGNRMRPTKVYNLNQSNNDGQKFAQALMGATLVPLDDVTDEDADDDDGAGVKAQSSGR